MQECEGKSEIVEYYLFLHYLFLVLLREFKFYGITNKMFGFVHAIFTILIYNSLKYKLSYINQSRVGKILRRDEFRDGRRVVDR